MVNRGFIGGFVAWMGPFCTTEVNGGEGLVGGMTVPMGMGYVHLH